MNFIEELSKKLVIDAKYYNLTRNPDFIGFNFIGYLKNLVTVNWVALVYADEFTESDIINYRDRYFEIVLKSSINYGLKPRARNPNGLICFVFKQGCSPNFIEFIRAQSRVSHAIPQGAIVVTWVLDLANQKIHTNHWLVSLFPPILILPFFLIPNISFFDSFMREFFAKGDHSNFLQDATMLDPGSISLLLQVLDFLFGEGSKVLEERRERQKVQPSKPLQKAEQTALNEVITSKAAALGLMISETSWFANQARIELLLNLLKTYTRNYYLAKEQYAIHGSASVPQVIVHNLNEAEQNIAATMKTLADATGSVYNKKFVIEEIDTYES